MKNNYNIKIDPDQLSSEQIKQHQDFDALLDKVQATPSPRQASFKSLYYIAGVVAAAMVGVLLYFNWVDSSDSIQGISTQEYLASQPYINPPMKDLIQDFDRGTIDADQGGEYEFENGSVVSVPPAAFIDQQGNTISGPVEIKYREYHDFIDFFVSGIPMEYDSAGVQYNLESAGMIEIYAEQNGERLNVAPGKSINVALISEISVPANDRANIPDFNIYRLDTTKRNWVYQGRDELTVIEEDVTGILSNGELGTPDAQYQNAIQELEQKEQTELAAIEASVPKPAKPVQPVKENGSDFVFNLEFAEEDIAFSRRADPSQAERQLDGIQDEINTIKRLYANTLWQVAPGNTDFNEEMVSQINWDDAKIEQLNNRDYQLTLINPNRTLEVIVNPVLSGDDYNAALEEFNQEMSTYEQKLAERESALVSQKEALAVRMAEEKALAKKSYEEQVAYYQAQGNTTAVADLMITNKVLNEFSVSEFGVWNCDRPLPPFIYNIKGEFVENKTKKQFKHNTAYMVDKNRNTVHRFYASEKADVVFDSKSENILWMITDENKLAVFTPDQFREISDDRKEHTFVMDMIDQPIASEEDLRKILIF